MLDETVQPPNRANFVAATTVGAYVLASSAILASDDLHGSMGYTPLLPALFALHFLLGLGVGRWWALVLCLWPAAWSLTLGRAVPGDPDITNYSGMLFLLSLMALPVTCRLTALGVLAGRRVGHTVSSDGSRVS